MAMCRAETTLKCKDFLAEGQTGDRIYTGRQERLRSYRTCVGTASVWNQARSIDLWGRTCAP
jgi:hypothetical protein